MYVSDTFYTGVKDTSEIIEYINNNIYGILVANDESGVASTNDSAGYITVFKPIVNGWCVGVDTLRGINEDFFEYMRKFCAERGFKEPSFLYGATYW